MSNQSDEVNLAALDDAREAVLDPSIWSANLAALRRQDPRFAADLETTSVPKDWRPIVALDGCTTYRTETPGQAATWLADSAAPRTRAKALLTAYSPGELNATLPSIGTGWALSLLLQRLPSQNAVFVFEAHAAAIAAVLRAVDLHQALAEGRCILVPPAQEVEFPARLLRERTGLLPPGNILSLPHVSPARLQEVWAICERTSRQVAQERKEQVGKLAAETSAVAFPDGRNPRVAIVGLKPTTQVHTVCDSLGHALAQLAWDSRTSAVRGPNDAHLLPHCQRLTEFAPELTICVDHPRTLLPLQLGGAVCEWYLNIVGIPEQLANDGTVRLAASPRVADALRSALKTDENVLDFWWACDQSAEADDDTGDLADTIILVVDRPDDSPEACGIKQPTHKTLWEQLHTTAAQVWAEQDILNPRALLNRAEQACDVRLGEAALRAQMLRLVEHILIPAVVTERISSVLSGESLKLRTVGTGWTQQSSKTVETSTEDMSRLDKNIGRPLAAIFAGGTDPLSAALLHAAACGWPLLIHSPGGASRSGALAHIMHPEQHYEPFAGAKEICTALRRFRDDAPTIARRAARTRSHVLANHTYEKRVQSLAETLRARASRATTSSRRPGKCGR